jgi:hypothetical protein
MDMNARKSTSLIANGSYRFSIAPMMDWTERHNFSNYYRNVCAKIAQGSSAFLSLSFKRKPSTLAAGPRRSKQVPPGGAETASHPDGVSQNSRGVTACHWGRGFESLRRSSFLNKVRELSDPSAPFLLPRLASQFGAAGRELQRGPRRRLTATLSQCIAFHLRVVA